eukprot:TRINITY_DN12157_c0_g1::TRINITY_DN12157_c0_g1_i1::g.26580::m.26580 TRINITY_DN12157_c0_g1::TRINITY_DN12157_c0_g1_i1::g.26580  ORF type:complete len:221 (+),score=16.25 TRINITY_DN12157_c0_g1_i1:173-835(+)
MSQPVASLVPDLNKCPANCEAIKLFEGENSIGRSTLPWLRSEAHLSRTQAKLSIRTTTDGSPPSCTIEILGMTPSILYRDGDYVRVVKLLPGALQSIYHNDVFFLVGDLLPHKFLLANPPSTSEIQAPPALGAFDDEDEIIDCITIHQKNQQISQPPLQNNIPVSPINAPANHPTSNSPIVIMESPTSPSPSPRADPPLRRLKRNNSGRAPSRALPCTLR